ncbi:TPA: RepB family plasmid replication initiator protein [Enterococcus faecium]|uniref:RepB family plasmid replication initiator protein n=1 Tax=Enterococcus faecium TaxID=1352 RepID=UPI0018CB11CF|nr:RepB family plasmid replication initiator protein [Enterococcus faecium]MBG8247139.1 RepB family plasmid replication initiator protein [Enterococcus faecium]MBG8255687.1 RepB family plasmid replication initiator protein [Enterococcus faecium]MBH0882396.1 RepB family plasmid replication initiator protein [Enterococcus faecium]MBH0890543.1 RepB family plasmid replication initiator protein [Enterococcus faecium]MBH1164411.1 RepB family plasmid replication initiator protein [Enterococcus faeciu
MVSSSISDEKNSQKIDFICDNKEDDRSVTPVEESISQKAVIIQMEDLDKAINHESNDLIKAVPKGRATTLKLFEMAVSIINPLDPPKDNTIYIDKAVLLSFFDNDKYKYAYLKRMIKQFVGDLIFDFSKSEEEGDIVAAISRATWRKTDNYVSIKFSDDIMPYLIDLSSDYTKYSAKEISRLDSKYSIILYRWLMMNYNKYKKYKNVKCKNPIISVSDLRILTNTVDKYIDRFGNFETFVLEKAQKEINEHTSIFIRYEKIKKGRSYESIQFFIDDNIKNMPKDIEKLKPRQTKEEREKQRKVNAADAMASEYTQILFQNRFLGPLDFMDVSLMDRLQTDLYPLYDELKTKVSLKGNSDMKIVKEHIEHVSKYKEHPVSGINDIVAYLRTTVSNYLKDKTNFLN